MPKTNTKPTGRPKGSKNKISSANRELAEQIVKDALEGVILQDIALLTPKERVDAVIKLFGMTTPKQTEAKVDMSLEEVKHPHKNNLYPQEVYDRLKLDIAEEEEKLKNNNK